MNDCRLDVELVKRGLCSSRSLAGRMISEGRVQIKGVTVTKAATQVDELTEISLSSPPLYVGRGGEKLEAALDHFQLNVKGLRCLDVGASTGGFTDCLLQHGAGQVFSVDVGHGQLVEKIRNDPRVEWHEGLDIRKADLPGWRGSFEFITVDVSFISLKMVLPGVIDLAREGGSLLALVKPQFEVGKNGIGKGGIVKDPEAREKVVAGMAAFVEAMAGWTVRGTFECPVAGGDGNRESFLWAKKSAKS